VSSEAVAFLAWTTKAGEPRTLFFDVVTDLTIELNSSATEHPVERGANIADHVKKELDKVSFEAFVSNAPIEDTNGRGGAVKSLPIRIEKYKAPLAPTPGAVFSALGSAARDAVGSLLGKKEAEYAAQVLQWETPFDAPSDTLQELEKLRDEVQLVNVFTTNRTYESMFLESVQMTANADTGTGRTFRLAFKELRQVEVRFTNAPKPTEIRAVAKVPKGTQGPTPLPDGGPKMSFAKALAKPLVLRLPEWMQNRYTGLGSP
jgi:hypothetical protein